MKTDDLAPRRILADTFAFVQAQPGFIAAMIAIDAVPQIAMEYSPGDWTRLSSLLGLVTLYLQLLVTFRALSHAGLTHPDQPEDRPTDGRYPGAFLLDLLMFLAVAIGLALLIVPGVLLLALWSLALPALAAERLPVVAAMRRSWALTRPYLASFVGLVLLAAAPFLAVLALVAVTVLIPSFDSPTSLAVADLLLSVWAILTPAFWACAYAARRRMEDDIDRDGTDLTPPDLPLHSRTYV